MSKIKVFLTGGTIGSNIDKNNSVADVAVTGSTANQLFDFFRAERPGVNVEFETEILFNVLSENISFNHWQIICRRIYDDITRPGSNNYDGIIITHGTDTLAYTAAFLSFMLWHIGMPVLIVSSDYPLNDERANGYGNFTAAVDFITQVGLRGVYVPFSKKSKDSKTATEIHMGSRLLQSLPFSHDFMSLGNVRFGEISISNRTGIFERNGDLCNPSMQDIKIQSPSKYQIPQSSLLKLLNLNETEIKNIFCVTPYPGINYGLIKFNQNPPAVLHMLYHSGTACETVLPFAKKCIGSGIDFYAAPFDSRNTLYRTSENMNDIGIRFIKNMSVEAAYVKLLLAYNIFDDDNIRERQKFIEEDVAFEHLNI